jgi:hypothetical protein
MHLRAALMLCAMSFARCSLENHIKCSWRAARIFHVLTSTLRHYGHLLGMRAGRRRAEVKVDLVAGDLVCGYHGSTAALSRLTERGKLYGVVAPVSCVAQLCT